MSLFICSSITCLLMLFEGGTCPCRGGSRTRDDQRKLRPSQRSVDDLMMTLPLPMVGLFASRLSRRLPSHTAMNAHSCPRESPFLPKSLCIARASQIDSTKVVEHGSGTKTGGSDYCALVPLAEMPSPTSVLPPFGRSGQAKCAVQLIRLRVL